jgi:hypothetical protein
VSKTGKLSLNFKKGIVFEGAMPNKTENSKIFSRSLNAHE